MSEEQDKFDYEDHELQFDARMGTYNRLNNDRSSSTSQAAFSKDSMRPITP